MTDIPELEIDFASFVDSMRRDVELFAEEYEKRHCAQPDNYPATISSKDWFRRFILFKLVRDCATQILESGQPLSRRNADALVEKVALALSSQAMVRLSKREIDLLTFLDSMRRDIELFAKGYEREHRKHPDMYPLKMLSGDWLEQFLIFEPERGIENES